MRIFLNNVGWVTMPVRPKECLYHTCHEPEPMHSIVWKCPAGHRKANWYCGEHIQKMTELAFAPPQDGLTSGSLCVVCRPFVQMRPVMEGV